jgi:flagellar hook-associated protein 3 FlgL
LTSIPATGPIVITPNVLASTLDNGLLSNQASLASLEQQIATGNAINTPSDNPAGASTMLQLQANLQRANQYSTNAQDGVGWLTLANSTVSSMISQMQSVISLVQGVSGSALTSQKATLTSTADQIQGSLQELINLGNTTYEGSQPIFAGTAAQAFSTNGTYVGAGNAPTRTVAPGTQVAVSVTGDQIFQSSAGNLIAPGGLLAGVVSDLKANNAAGAEAQLGNLQTALSQMETAAGSLGAQQQQMSGFSQQATSSSTALQQELGAVQSTNMAEAITSLQLQQTSYQEALYATSQLSTDSLAKYL